ncbi:MAG: hypothetical protein K0U24_04770 [Gammaproteobacteria bacterium]|nr:hypothetical protein [Gammaproteobacteria bacterium]
MKKQLTTALFCMGAFLSAPTQANNEHMLQLTPSVDYDLPANEPQAFTNVFRWTINAECTIIKSDAKSAILFKVLRKEGRINDITLSRGESLRFNIQPKETFNISAIPGAAVELTNEGETTITVHCTEATRAPDQDKATH